MINLKRLAKAYLRRLRHQIGLQSLKSAIWGLTTPILWFTNAFRQ